MPRKPRSSTQPPDSASKHALDGKESQGEPIPSYWSGLQLGEWLGVNQSSLRVILAPVKCSTPEGYEVRRAVPALFEHFKGIAEKTTRTTADARARQQEADAARAEIALEQDLGKLVSKDEMRRLLEQAIVSLREKIRTLTTEGRITIDQAKLVCGEIATLTLPAAGEGES